MDMSRAAIAPRQPHVSQTDRAHPLFSLYEQHRTSCSNLLIEASTFRDWLYQYETQLRDNEATKHADFPAFKAWLIANQGGARKCPAGTFPHNFNYWREGGRW